MFTNAFIGRDTLSCLRIAVFLDCEQSLSFPSVFRAIEPGGRGHLACAAMGLRGR